MASPTRPASHEQEEAVCLQAFPLECQSSNNPTPLDRIARAKATEVALLAFFPEQHDGHREATDSAKVPFPCEIADAPPISPARHGAVSGHEFPVRRLVLAVLVCSVAVAAVGTLSRARLPAKSVAAAAAPVAAEAGAATDTPDNPVAARSAHVVAQSPPLPRVAMAPRAPRTAGTVRRAAVGPTRAASNVPLRQPSEAPSSTPASGFRGSLAVSSSPEGAEVYVNGIPVGVTPVLLRDLAAGSRVVRLELTGHERWSSAVRIIASEETRVAVTLRPLSAR